MPDGTVLGLLAAGLGVGVASALTPVLPAEAYVIAVALTNRRDVAIGVALAVAVGQTVGKLVIFTAVRGAGSSRWLSRLRARSTSRAAAGQQRPGADAPPSRRRRAVARVRAWLARASEICLAALSGRTGWTVVLLSGAVGLPPLLAVAIIAGASTMRRRTFVPAVLVGRALRFGVIAAAPQVFRSLLGG